jgi:Type II restriction endonuclease EcoO109I
VNGCCYGKDNKPDKGDYFKYCGQQFWSFISGDADLYTNLIEPLGHKAEQKNEAFYEAYAPMINRFTHEFVENFCDQKGAIDWKKLVQFNSSN